MTTFVLPRPVVERVLRSAAGRVAVGDRAIASVGPGLVRLLQSPWLGSEEPLGVAYHAGYSVPLGLAITAAHAILDAVAGDGTWTVRRADLQCRDGAGVDDTLVAYARVAEFRENDAQVVLAARTAAGRTLFEGTMRFIRLRGAGYAGMAGAGGAAALRPASGTSSSISAIADPAAGNARVAVADVADIDAFDAAGSTASFTDPPDPPGEPLMQWGVPRIASDAGVHRLVVEPSALLLLMHPVAGGREPIGRRTHPLSGIIVGGIVSGALLAAGVQAPWRATNAVRALRFVLFRETALRDRVVVEVAREGAQRIVLRNPAGDVLATGEVELEGRALGAAS